eukprot:29951_1
MLKNDKLKLNDKSLKKNKSLKKSKSLKQNKNDYIKEEETKNSFEQRIKESMGEQINILRLDLSLITKQINGHITTLDSKRILEYKENMEFMVDKIIKSEKTQNKLLSHLNDLYDESKDIINDIEQKSSNKSIESELNLKQKSEIINNNKKKKYKIYVKCAELCEKFIKTGKRKDDKTLLELNEYIMNKYPDRNIDINRLRRIGTYEEILEITSEKKLDIKELKKGKRQLDHVRIYWKDNIKHKGYIKQNPPNNLCRYYPECNKSITCYYYHPTEEEMNLWYKNYNLYAEYYE